MRAQDEERRRIARELHDETAQNLFAITFNLARLQQHGAARQVQPCRHGACPSRPIAVTPRRLHQRKESFIR